MDIRVAAYGVIVRQDLMLLAHWREGDHSGWTLPGGGIEFGEDPADAAVREIREETGYEASLDCHRRGTHQRGRRLNRRSTLVSL